jgi:hypothetical protein
MAHQRATEVARIELKFQSIANNRRNIDKNHFVFGGNKLADHKYDAVGAAVDISTLHSLHHTTIFRN